MIAVLVSSNMKLSPIGIRYRPLHERIQNLRCYHPELPCLPGNRLRSVSIRRRLGRWLLRVSLGRCLRRTEVVSEGGQVSRLGCGQVGELRGGLAWGGGVCEG